MHCFPVKGRADVHPIAAARWDAERVFRVNRFTRLTIHLSGATFTYYLKEELKTKKAKRQEAERGGAKKRGPRLVFRGRADLSAEDGRGKRPAIIFTITDSSGRIVRRLTGPVTAGIQRVNWDLRYPASEPAAPHRIRTATIRSVIRRAGPLVMAGRLQSCRRQKSQQRYDSDWPPAHEFQIVVEGQDRMSFRRSHGPG